MSGLGAEPQNLVMGVSALTRRRHQAFLRIVRQGCGQGSWRDHAGLPGLVPADSCLADHALKPAPRARQGPRPCAAPG